ncbi:hypothetical protein SUDANB58_05537 [Streptomyces sp. enrichment culture]|uniref:hypothetical protein n=1 Tax=Streptomyces sp. enrichment culture TaxID=1795815 RepID=UPI003F557E71
MASTFEELVAKRRAADQAHQRVEELRHSYGAPTQSRWNPQQSDIYETAVRAWRDLDRDAQAAVTGYAREQGQARDMVEEEVRRAAQGAEPS